MAVAEQAVAGAGAGAVLGPWGALGGAVIGGLMGAFGGESDQEAKLKEVMAKLEAYESEAGETAFSKSEIMDVMLPQAEKMIQSSTDIAASMVGKNVGESGIAGGQATGEYFAGSLAPIIGKGQELQANAQGQYAQMFANMSDNAKNRLINLFKTEVDVAGGLPSMNEFEQITGGALGMAGAVGNISGDLDMLLAEIGKMSAEGERGNS